MASVCVCTDYFTVDDDGQLCLIPGRQGLRETLIFDNPGTFQFQKADYPWLARVMVRVQGAGGGSAGANAAAGECIVRPGGTGGGYSESLVEAASLGAMETIVVGAGGDPGDPNDAGGAGGNSSFGGFATAPGGSGGTASQTSGTVLDATSGISGPLAGIGDLNLGGGASDGAIRLNATNGLSGKGGDSHLGTGGFPRATEGAGTAPRGVGGGAGGALSYGGSFSGGTGGIGLVIVELYG
ncbi:hypothetical protein GCM10010387_15370 [Streptomyces inusitatus]|uniref:Glycine-rich domain-containing protein n=1 Tax=Streptomyces inusitatus TaxID=68221 RepID=A0A918UNS5_9ACTN|nr:hypothetical protein [Streptomyces inusitatus]GGZ23188.1 hypothetical protein GCM10010387_15370 [Streptomyces inusitatus]